MPAVDAQLVAQALGGAVRSGSGWKARCPAHDDRSASLTLSDADGDRLLVKCHAGCGQDAVVEALKARNLWPEREKPAPRKRIVATYDYRDRDGAPLFQALRYQPKTFRQRRPDGNGGWSWSITGVKAVPFRLPELVAAVADGELVFVVEGEKDVGNLVALGLAATCNAGGAGKWRPEFAEYFKGANVIVLPDNDQPGRDHGTLVAASLAPVATRVRVVELPGLPAKGDVSDWLAAGGTRDELLRLADAAPAWALPAESIPQPKPAKRADHVIRIIAADLPAVVDAAEKALIRGNADIFQRGGMLVRPGYCPVAVRTGEVSGLRLIPVATPSLVELFTGAAPWEKFDGRSEEWVPTKCPDQVAEIYAARAGFWRVRVLTGIIESPTLRPDGSVLDRPGYDTATGLLLRPNCVVPAVKSAPTRDDALDALGTLSALLESFPFVGSGTPDWSPDRSVALSAILTAVIRRSLVTAPLHGFTAPVAGSGKSMLVDIASTIATGQLAAVISQGKTPEEFEKRIGSALIGGDAIVSIDNCEAPLGGELLCQVLTQPTLKLRPLGRSALVEVPSNSAIFATGNNLTLVGDMTRRALVGRLDPRCERPELRVFASDPLETIALRRGEFVAAALTVLRAYWVAGRPHRLPALGGFAEWSNTVRSALVWLGEADPIETIEHTRTSDPTLDTLSAVLATWRSVIGIERVSVGDVIRRATSTQLDVIGRTEFQYPDFREALLSAAGDGGAINGRKLGKWLMRHKDRMVSGMHIFRDTMSAGNITWRLHVARIN